MKEGNELTWAQVVMAANAPMMTKAALVDGRTDVGVLPTGQVVGVIDELPTVAELIGRIVAQATEVLDRLGSGPKTGVDRPVPSGPGPIASLVNEFLDHTTGGRATGLRPLRPPDGPAIPSRSTPSCASAPHPPERMGFWVWPACPTARPSS